MTQVTGSHSVEPTRPADGREVGIAALAPPRAACGPSCLCLGGNGMRGWECGGGVGMVWEPCQGAPLRSAKMLLLQTAPLLAVRLHGAGLALLT